MVVDDLDVVAVGVEDVRGEVAAVVLGTLAGLAVVGEPRGRPGLVEAPDGIVSISRCGTMNLCLKIPGSLRTGSRM